MEDETEQKLVDLIARHIIAWVITLAILAPIGIIAWKVVETLSSGCP